jgi:predicted HTH transcriptional regulator
MTFPKKDDDFIKELIKQKESETLDFKHSITNSKKIAKTLTAFANHKGGKLAVGINDKKTITGIDESEEIFMIEEAANKWCVPPVSVSFEVYEVQHVEEQKLDEELYILIVSVPQSIDRHAVLDTNGKPVYYTRYLDKTVPIQAAEPE